MERRRDGKWGLWKGWGCVAVRGRRWGQGGQEVTAEWVCTADRREEPHGQPKIMKDEVRKRGLRRRDWVPTWLRAVPCTAISRVATEQPPK